MSASAANTPGPVAPGSGRAWAVPGYTEMRSLGGGGFGEVILATHDTSGTPVAIKYLHPDLLRNREYAAAFRVEARTLAGLDSPHVVRLYEYVEGAAGAAIVMELVEGVTLAKLLERQGKTTPEAALVVLYGSLLGLAAAHAKGVVHRDYKPANVLVNGQGASKLTDFGIAALAGDRPVPTGTLCYMPPEQFEGAKASPAADVYAATVTFYQCLVGQVPFDGRTATELYDKHKSAPVPMDPVPEPLRPVIARGLAKDPRSRPSDAASLAAELRDAATDSYGEAWESRGRSHLAETALLLLALLWPSGGSSAAAGSAVEQVQLTDPARGARQPQPTHPGQPAQATHAAQAGHTTGSSGRTGETEAEHLHHIEHLKHLENLDYVDHVEHEEHIEHLKHVEHEEHLAHLRHLRREDGRDSGDNGDGSGRQSTGQRMVRRVRAHPVAAAVIAGAAAVVIAVVAAFATTGHSTPPAPPGIPSPSGAPSPSGSTAPANTPAGVPSFTATYTMTRNINVCSPARTCITGPLPLTIDCNGSSCTASSSHWGSSHQLAFNGTSFSFTGTDSGVYGCGSPPDPATITLNLTVVSWSGSGATRKPQQLSGPYNVTAPATAGCSAWHLEATLTSQ